MKQLLIIMFAFCGLVLTQPFNVMAEFGPAHEHVAAVEGEYSNLITDRGGETYKGISREYHPEAKIWKYVDRAKDNCSTVAEINNYLRMNMNAQGAVTDFYKEQYFDALSLGEIESQTIANELYDTAVNQGRKTSAIYLQRCLNFLNQNGRLYQDIEDDGVIGSVTLGTLDKCLSYYNRYGKHIAERGVVKILNGQQFARYMNIVTNDPGQEINFFGWITHRV